MNEVICLFFLYTLRFRRSALTKVKEINSTLNGGKQLAVKRTFQKYLHKDPKVSNRSLYGTTFDSRPPFATISNPFSILIFAVY